MKVVFVYRGYESLALEQIAALLNRAGHETELVFSPALFDDDMIIVPALARLFDDRDRVADEVVARKPDLVGFSVVSNQLQWSLEIAGRIKRRIEVPIVFGGVHPTLMPENVAAEDAVDYVVEGEGEYAALELAEALAAGERRPEIKNLLYRNNGDLIRFPMRPRFENFERLPHPDKELFFREAPYLRELGYIAITSRGCPYQCTYCNSPSVARKYPGAKPVWRRPVETLIDELVAARRRYRIPYVWFADDTFVMGREWMADFAEQYRKSVGLPYWCTTHPATLTKENVRLLKESGCQEVEFGVQSFSPEVRREVLRRHYSNDVLERAAENLERAGIPYRLDIILDLPRQSPDELKDFTDFLVRHKPSKIHSFWLKWLPGSEITETAHRQGRLDDEQIRRINSGAEAAGLYEANGSRPKEMMGYAKLFTLMSLLGSKTGGRLARLNAQKLLARMPELPLQVVYNLLYLARRDREPSTMTRQAFARYRHFLPRMMLDKLAGGADV